MRCMLRSLVSGILSTALLFLPVATASAQQAPLTGIVRDETGAALPGVAVELRGTTGTARQTQSDTQGRYQFDAVAPGRAELAFVLVNFATVRRTLNVAVDSSNVDAVMHLALSADVTVTVSSTSGRSKRRSGLSEP